jgi:carboxylesterase
MFTTVIFSGIIFFVLLAGIFGLPEYNARFDEKRVAPPLYMKGALPIFRAGKKFGNTLCLLCHGYADSAFQVNPLAAHLNRIGYSVRTVLLPGHGSRVEDMVPTRYHHWLEYFESIYLSEAKKYKKIILIGQSMGGNICMEVAAKNRDTFRPAGIVAISNPAILNGFVNGRFYCGRPALVLTGFLKIFMPILRLQNSEKQRERNPYVGYGRIYALAALHSFKQSLPGFRRSLPLIDVPFCSIMSQNDRTVSIHNQYYQLQKVRSPVKRAYSFIMPEDETNRHLLITHTASRKRVFHYVEQFVADALKQS